MVSEWSFEVHGLLPPSGWSRADRWTTRRVLKRGDTREDAARALRAEIKTWAADSSGLIRGCVRWRVARAVGGV